MIFYFQPRSTGAVSTDPGEGNVADGVDYAINGINHTGTKVFQMELGEIELEGPQSFAILEEQ